MKNVASMITEVAAATVAVIKALVVAFIFANILFTTGYDPIAGIGALVDAFLNAGLGGLLALMVFVSFMK